MCYFKCMFTPRKSLQEPFWVQKRFMKARRLRKTKKSGDENGNAGENNFRFKMATISGEENEQDYEVLAYQQRLKAALHYTVGRICEESGEATGLKFSRQFIAALTETAFRQTESFAVDLELFSKHAKRSTINSEDVKLLARKSPALADHIKGLSKEIAAAHDAEKASKKGRKTKKQKQNGVAEQ